jgi:kinesin family member C1
MPLSNNGTADAQARGARRAPLDDLKNVSLGQRRGASGIPKLTQKRREVTPAAAAAAAVAAAAADGNGAGEPAPPPLSARDRAAANAARRTTGVAAGRRRPAGSNISFTTRPQEPKPGVRRFNQRDDKRAEDAESELAQARREAAECRQQLTNNAEMTKTMSDMRDAFLQSKDVEVARMEHLNMKIGELEGRVSTAEQAAAEKSNELNEALISLAKADHKSEIALAGHSAKLAVEAARAGALEQELKSSNTTIAALEADKKFVDSVVRDKDEEVEQLKSKHANCDKNMELLKTEADRVDEALRRATAAKATLEEQLDEANAHVRELRQAACDHDCTIAQRDAELRKLEAQHAALTAELASLRTVLDAERAGAATLRASLRQVGDEADARTRTFEQDISRLRREAEEYKREAEDKVQCLEGEKARAVASQNETRIELQGAKSDAAQYRAAVSSQEGAVTALKSHVAAAEVRLSAQSSSCAAQVAEIKSLRGEMERQLAEIAKLEAQAHVDEDERRKLHNSLQELKGNIRVFCRVRPLLDGGEGHAAASGGHGSVFQYHTKSRGISAVMAGQDPAVSTGKASLGGLHAKEFTFDRVFGPTSTQEDVFGEISQLVQSALDGYRVCIFAYGQTGSGKTHTIMGSERDAGMIPRSVQQIFERAERLQKDQWQFQFRASFLEIYNEKIRDLLAKGGKGASASRVAKKEEYEVTYDRATNQTNVEGLTVVDVLQAADADRLIATAARNRSTAATLSNAESSRSHSIFRLYITGRNASSRQTLRGVLNLVDLAGSERVKVSGAEGDRLKETKAINKSLSHLSTVISNLANRERHIPYRSSKLTRVLQDSLGGDSKTLMFVNVAPDATSYNESICSLRFAEQVNACEIGTAKRSTKVDLHADQSPQL